ncbi:hypothetical protein DPL19_14390 [Salmonella enterica subsp. enterica serovar Montevideo]|uniref:DNA replication and repair protein RecF n=1 Tax=Salmonella montevideo TaxID=115981 RepID=A0A609D4H9_SALMO|nr:hypothetical protein [Salmonella enterica subsp. enterica serovar Montevideo]
MSLSRLLIKDFRNIENADLALSPGFNFLVGANGSGKTSVLEAIYTLGHGRAFRSLQPGRVIRYEQLRPWDKELIPLAEQISTWRAEYSIAIAQDMADTCQQFLPEFSLTFSFQRGWEKETDYADVLERSFERDRMLTYTAHGPHKADFRIRADGAPVEDTLSRGQLKLLMCALRLAQGEFLTRESGRRCLYLIDDFASELDDARRGLLASRLKATQSQVFVSAISAEHVIDMSDENSKMFTVEKGKITD